MNRDVRKTVAVCIIISFVVFSFCFSMVPLYNVLCRNTGWGGRVKLSPAQANLQAAQLNRTITMQFVTTKNNNLNWSFYPEKPTLEIHPEQDNKIFFHVKNNSAKTITVQAIPSITPWQAAKHMHKVQCFCFTQQTLKAGESLSMPVIFRIDKEVPTDIQTITLAYTLFDVTNQKKADAGSKP
jgi:cytochrome c oxidase assembly protein subunit 11